MLSHQAKLYCSSPNARTSQSKIDFLAKTSSSSALRSEDQEARRQLSSYSKLLKQKDMKILSLLERQRNAQAELAYYRKTHNTLQSDLSFFKQKLQEQLYRNICLQSELQLINTTIKGIMLSIVGLLQGNDISLSSFANYLQQMKESPTGYGLLDLSKKLLSGLEFQVAELGKCFCFLRKDHEGQKMLKWSTDSRLDCHKMAEEVEKEALRGQLSDLLTLYQTRAIDSQEYKQEIHNLRIQREYIKQLLISSQKEKNSSANEIYEFAKRSNKVNFEEMNRSEVVRLCMNLLSRMKDLDEERCELEEKVKSMQITQKNNYNQMLKSVKQLQKNAEKKPVLRRMASMPYH